MKSTAIAAALLGGACVAQEVAHAQQTTDFGKQQYEEACTACHGATGKGGVFHTGTGDARSVDLTTLAKRNNGIFPFQQVFEAIDGSQVLREHESRDMPIWGLEFRIQAGDAHFKVPYGSGAYARARIFALTEYVSRLQVK
jgi:mono/diheme cytochrome c family protein